MTDEIMPSELGAFTNNLPNKEGIKKLCDKVNNGGTTYTAGDNIQISAENVISATDTKYTAGTNVSISEQNVISATDTKYTGENGIEVTQDDKIKISNDWIECPNKLDDVVTYGIDYEYLITGVDNFSKPIAFELIIGDNVTITSKSDLNNIPVRRLTKVVDMINEIDSIISIQNSSSPGKIPLYRLSPNVTVSAKQLGDFTNKSYYDVDGVTIDNTNISNYITVSGDDYTVIKPFIVDLYSPGSFKYGCFIFVGIIKVIVNVTEIGRNYTGQPIDISSIYKLITGATLTYNEGKIEYLLPSYVNSGDVISFNDTSVKVYRRKKLSKIPVEVTP